MPDLTVKGYTANINTMCFCEILKLVILDTAAVRSAGPLEKSLPGRDPTSHQTSVKRKQVNRLHVFPRQMHVVSFLFFSAHHLLFFLA